LLAEESVSLAASKMQMIREKEKIKELEPSRNVSRYKICCWEKQVWEKQVYEKFIW